MYFESLERATVETADIDYLDFAATNARMQAEECTGLRQNDEVKPLKFD